VREGISNWPTIPQLYAEGEFVGGCDIGPEMLEAAALKAMADEMGVAYDKSQSRSRLPDQSRLPSSGLSEAHQKRKLLPCDTATGSRRLRAADH
jgi:hypothetical protein